MLSSSPAESVIYGDSRSRIPPEIDRRLDIQAAFCLIAPLGSKRAPPCGQHPRPHCILDLCAELRNNL